MSARGPGQSLGPHGEPASASEGHATISVIITGLRRHRRGQGLAGRPSAAEREAFSLTRDAGALEELAARLVGLTPELIVLEATSGFEVAVAAALAGVGLQLAVVNPRQSRAFARAIGGLAKTDRLDAEVIALFAERVRPQARAIPDAQMRALADLVARRRASPPWWGLRRSTVTAVRCAAGV